MTSPGKKKPTTALTPEEKEQLTSSVQPSVGRIAAGVVGGALLVGAVAAGGTSAAIDPPEPVSISTDSGPLAPAEDVHVGVHDPHDVLSAGDEEQLHFDAQRLDLPEVVDQLHYIVFAENDENVNDTVENYLRREYPDLIGDDYFADGTLFVGVGLDPRQSFVFAGSDVADALHLWGGSHLDNAVVAIQPGVVDGNIPGGLFAGAQAATDVDSLADDLYQDHVNDRASTIALTGVGGGTLTGIVVAAVGAWRRHRSSTLAQARTEMDIVSSQYGELAGRLDAIDIRANSLTSPFAHATMRKEWAEVRDRFLDIHASVDKLGALTPSSPDKDLLAKSEEITAAALTTRQVSYAEENIDKIFALEHGDDTVRKQEVKALRDDIVEAQVEVKKTDSGLYRELQGIRDSAEALAQQTQAPDFLDRYILLLSDYRVALEQLKREQFSDLNMAKATELRPPAVYERNYRPGYGYDNFVPYWAMSTWHISNAETQQASSANTSFSSGFSGAGGSSSF